jgi:hypothetical protein
MLHLMLLSFGTLFIVWYSEKDTRNGGWVCFHLHRNDRETPSQLGLLERDNLGHWTFVVLLLREEYVEFGFTFLVFFCLFVSVG